MQAHTLSFRLPFITDTYDELVRQLALSLQLPIVSVNYRLAPTYMFPASIDDCFTALRYLMQNAKMWKIDSSRIIVAGCNPLMRSFIIFNVRNYLWFAYS